MCIVYVCSVLTSSIITSIKMLVILFLNHVYYTSHLDIVSYPLVALCGMIVTLLDSSDSFFFVVVVVDGVPMFVLPHGLTNEYRPIISILILVLQAYLPLS